MSNSNRIFTGSVSSCATKFLTVLFAVSFASSASWARRGGYVRAEQGQSSQQFEEVFGQSSQQSDYGFQKCISGGRLAAEAARQHNSTDEITWNAKVALESLMALMMKSTKVDEPFLSPGSKAEYFMGSGTYIGCGIVLTAAHNVVVNLDPANKFYAVNSPDVYEAWKNGLDGRKLDKVLESRVHPDFLARFNQRKDSFKIGDDAFLYFGEKESAAVDLALVKVPKALVSDRKKFPIAPGPYIESVSRTSGKKLSLAGYGAENLNGRPLGSPKIADSYVAAEGIQPAAGALNPGVLSRGDGSMLGGDSGGPVFATERNSSGAYRSALVGVLVVYTGTRETVVSYLTGDNRNKLRSMWDELTKGESCPDPNPFN